MSLVIAKLTDEEFTLRVGAWLALTAFGWWLRTYFRKKEKAELTRSGGTFEAADAIKTKYRTFGACGTVLALIAIAKFAVLVLGRGE